MDKKVFIPIALVVAGVLVAAAVIYTDYSSSCKANESNISANQAAEKVISFINNKLLAGEAEALLVSAEEEGITHKIVFEVEGQQVEWRSSKDGRFVFPQRIDLQEEEQEPSEEEASTIGRFSKTSEDVCLEDGKPIVYFFGSKSCPHCSWEHPITEEVMAKFGGLISFHNNMDNNEDKDVFGKYSTGGIPTTVLGCQYYRVGSGENLGEEENARVLTALTCQLTGGQPGDVCSEVQDLIDHI